MANIRHSRLDELCWYIVQTHSKQEDRVEKNLRTCNVVTLNPRVKKVRCNEFTGKPVLVASPLFPRYIFAKFRLDESLHTVRFTRGVYSVVSFGDYPTPVAEEVISFIRARIGSDGHVVIGDFPATQEPFSPGDRVLIKEGLLRNLSGIFERQVSDGERVRILLQTLNSQIHAELGIGQVTKAG